MIASTSSSRICGDKVNHVVKWFSSHALRTGIPKGRLYRSAGTQV